MYGPFTVVETLPNKLIDWCSSEPNFVLSCPFGMIDVLYTPYICFAFVVHVVQLDHLLMQCMVYLNGFHYYYHLKVTLLVWLQLPTINARLANGFTLSLFKVPFIFFNNWFPSTNKRVTDIFFAASLFLVFFHDS